MAARDGRGAQKPAMIGGARFWFRDARGARAEALGAALLAATRDPGRALKRGRRKFLFAVQHGDREYLVKVNHYPPGPRGWLRRSKARREWERARAVAARGIDTPLFAAVAEERSRSGRLLRCLAAVERLEGAVDLAECWRAARPPWRAQKNWARALGALAAQMHGAGVLQRDFAPNNLLVVPGRETPRLLPIDFERAELRRRIDPDAAAVNLAKLYRYLYDAPRGLWWRCLLAYCRGDAAAARALARRVAAELPVMLHRDRAHLRRTAGENNRRFRSLGASRGWAHRAIPPAALDAALRGEAAPCVWRVALSARSPGEAFDCWVLAQALSQRGGLIAKPLALVAPELVGRPEWTLFAARRPGETRWGDRERGPGVGDTALAVLVARIKALGLSPPSAREVVVCPEPPHARLLAPPA